MAAMQRVAPLSASASTSAAASSSYGGSSSSKAVEAVISDQFPAGLRVLVVDDDIICLKILERMLRRCLYNVTPCSQAKVALNLLRERKGCFDVVLSDVYMPDMDGYKLLEHVGLEMDLPVIMMSADGRTSAVMKGIRHGACDYLIKPIREEELKNIWQHVIRKKWNENKELEHSGSLDDNDRHKRGNDDAEYASSGNDGADASLKSQKKRSSTKEEEDENENDDPSSSKKPRVVWSVELHQQFVSAVNQLGIDKAVPKRILELMNVPGLTRENVASHLQKFRLYLKRISGVAQQGGIGNPLCGPVEPNVKIGPLGRFDIQALAASGQIPPQTFAALHAELLGRPTGNLVTAMDQPALLQASLQGPKCIPVEHGVAFGQPLVKCQSSISKHFPQSMVSVEDVPSGFGAWPSNNISAAGPSSTLGGLSSQNGNMLIDLLHQQQQQRQQKPQQQQQSTVPEPSRLISVQPSCLVVPSQSSASFQTGNSPASINQNGSFSKASVIDYSLLSLQSNNSSINMGQVSDGELQNKGILSGYIPPASLSSSVASCSMNADNCNSPQVQTSSMTFKASRNLPTVQSTSDVQGPYGAIKPGEVLDQVPFDNIGYINKDGALLPTRFAGDDFQSPLSNSSRGTVFSENIGTRVKQEPNMEFMDNSKVGIPMLLQQFPPNELMSVFTE